MSLDWTFFYALFCAYADCYMSIPKDLRSTALNVERLHHRAVFDLN